MHSVPMGQSPVCTQPGHALAMVRASRKEISTSPIDSAMQSHTNVLTLSRADGSSRETAW